MLRLENISWSTPNGVKILNDLSLTVGDNELTVITGPNGGGKTTLAKRLERELPAVRFTHDELMIKIHNKITIVTIAANL